MLNKINNNREYKIWFSKPAQKWMEALPIGNGRIGAMIYGDVFKERIDISEITCYSGEPSLKNVKKGSQEAINKLRELLLQEQYEKTERLIDYVYGQKLNYGTNLPLGYLTMEFEYDGEVVYSDYKRELCLNSGVAEIEYKIKDFKFKREMFISSPHQVMVIKISSENSNTINMKIGIEGYGNNYSIYKVAENELSLFGKSRENIHSDGETGVDYSCNVKAITRDGIYEYANSKIGVRNSNEVIILISIKTSFKDVHYKDNCKEHLKRVSAISYEELYNAHINDHKKLFEKVDISLGEEDKKEDMPTDTRLMHYKNGRNDEDLISLMFQYGRYLLIASSRKDSPLPAHLQGVWNDNIACRIPWTCDMHLDINTQMNYWPAEITNLAECLYPLFRWIKNILVPSGRKIAKEYYGLKGWVAHIFSNAWGYTAPGWGDNWSVFPTGGIWIATHLWEHYLFSNEEDFLRNIVFPIYKEAVDFFLDYLVFDDKSGCYLPGPSISPENYFIYNGGKYALSMGVTCDVLLIRELFETYIKICSILNVDEPRIQKIKEKLQKLPPFKIGKYGQLQEWFYDYEEADQHHRHTSHLLSLYPFNQIDIEKTPELAIAAKKSIRRRTQPEEKWEDTGWARCLLILYSARLFESEEAYKHITMLLKKLTASNLLVFHPPIAGATSNVYELDGNTGLCAAIGEMLLQSHRDEVHLLPCLPKNWSKGYIKGLCARGGFEISMLWENNELKKAIVYSIKDNNCVLRYKGRKVNIKTKGGCKYVVDGNLNLLERI